MRIGQNPLRESKVTPPSQVQFCVVTHLPNQDEGYHEHRLDIIKLCLNSLRKHSSVGEINIFDNGSCPALLYWLQDEYKPNRLILSRNVGKVWAQNALIRMFPKDTLIHFNDDDVLLSPGFVETELQLLQEFPNVACASGAAIRTMFRWACDATIRWAQQEALLEVGRFIPDEQENDYAISIGRDPQVHREMTKDDRDYKITYNGIEAYATSHHMEFMGFQKQLVKATDWSDSSAMGSMRPWDYAMEKIGLRLATIKRYARHVGNVLDEGVYNQAKEERMFE